MENTPNTFIDTSLNLSYSKLHHAFLDDSNQDENQVNLDGFGWNKSHKKEEVNGLVEELNRANVENERLTEMLAVVCQNVNGLRNQMKAYVNTTTHGSSKDQIIHSNGARKRKHFEYNNGTIINSNGSSSRDEKYSSCKKAKEEFIKPKIYRVCAPIETSDDTSLIVKDGYLWRKYGQKVTKDNPWPRAYFKCSFAPTCLVKKKVQRSIGDQSVVVATYEGEHNHPLPSHLECKQSASTSITQGSSSLPVISTSQTSSGETITLNLTKPQSEDSEVKDSNTKNAKSHSLQQFLVDQMASSLTRDPTFRAAIAKAISGNLLQPN